MALAGQGQPTTVLTLAAGATTAAVMARAAIGLREWCQVVEGLRLPVAATAADRLGAQLLPLRRHNPERRGLGVLRHRFSPAPRSRRRSPQCGPRAMIVLRRLSGYRSAPS